MYTSINIVVSIDFTNKKHHWYQLYVAYNIFTDHKKTDLQFKLSAMFVLQKIISVVHNKLVVLDDTYYQNLCSDHKINL